MPSCNWCCGWAQLPAGDRGLSVVCFQVYYCRSLALAFLELTVVRRFHAYTHQPSVPPSLRAVLGRLSALYALWSLSQHTALLYRGEPLWRAPSACPGALACPGRAHCCVDFLAEGPRSELESSFRCAAPFRPLAGHAQLGSESTSGGTLSRSWSERAKAHSAGLHRAWILTGPGSWEGAFRKALSGDPGGLPGGGGAWANSWKMGRNGIFSVLSP